jgi:hypothetical protein
MKAWTVRSPDALAASSASRGAAALSATRNETSPHSERMKACTRALDPFERRSLTSLKMLLSNLVVCRAIRRFGALHPFLAKPKKRGYARAASD